jgi:hypothetical protein
MSLEVKCLEMMMARNGVVPPTPAFSVASPTTPID